MSPTKQAKGDRGPKTISDRMEKTLVINQTRSQFCSGQQTTVCDYDQALQVRGQTGSEHYPVPSYRMRM